MSWTLRRLTAESSALMDPLLDLFGRVFDEEDTYGRNRPRPAYLKALLRDPTFCALAACQEEQVIGGLVAYELRKFEQERSEVYLYDLAVAESMRRQGVATALIAEAQRWAASRGAYVVFVQADEGDTPAISLYSKLGLREDVLHFDLPVLSQ